MHASQPLVQRYRETAVKTANPLQLVVLLYDGAIQSLQEAESHVRSGNIAGRARAVNKAIAIISELQASLNMKEGGAIAGSLDRLYAYMKDRVFTGNIQQKGEPFGEVVRLLSSLRSAWCELAARGEAESVPASARMPKAGAGLLQEAMPPTGTMGSFSISG